MNYYSHHIGDYRRDTAHLSLLEHGVYRQLLDMYYLAESRIPEETEVVMRRLCAKTEEEKNAVLTVLSEFFKNEKGWVHTRCDKEIAEYKGKADRARSNGKLGGRPSKTKVVISGNQEQTQEKANHKPLTINQEPLTNISVSKDTGAKAPLSTDEIIFIYGVPLLTSAGVADKQARSFLGGLRKSHGDDALVDALRECIRAKPLQPLEWLAKTLPPRGTKPKLNKQEALEERNRAIVAQMMAEEKTYEAE